MKNILFTLLLTLAIAFNLPAQDKIAIDETDYENQEIEMADQFRSDGKIYVVVAVILVVLGGMFFYLYRIETKVKKLESEIAEQRK